MQLHASLTCRNTPLLLEVTRGLVGKMLSAVAREQTAVAREQAAFHWQKNKRDGTEPSAVHSFGYTCVIMQDVVASTTSSLLPQPLLVLGSSRTKAFPPITLHGLDDNVCV